MTREETPSPIPGLQVPPLEGQSLFLRPLAASDYQALHRLETSGDLGPRWRFRGSTPSPERWVQETWSRSLAQYLIVRKRDQQELGYVAVHQPNFQDGHAHLWATRLTEGRSPILLLGIGMFLRYVFACWNFRKLYMDVPEYNYDQFSSGLGSFFQMEGRLKDDLWSGGRLWDQIILAVYREEFLEKSAQMLSMEYTDGSRY